MNAEANKNTSPQWLSKILSRKKSVHSLRTVIEDFIERSDDDTPPDNVAVEQTLIGNILQLRDLTAFDVMIPRADIIALPIDIDRADLIEFVRKNPLSRFPVYTGNLDDIVGTVHIKDLFLAMAPNDGTVFDLQSLVRDVPIISPALPVFDLLHTMRTTRRAMMMVVDEYGGIDGLVTAGDVVEAIIGRLDDEHDTGENLTFIVRDDGSVIADARVPLIDFESHFGDIVTDEEEEDLDTIGGLVMSLAGRIPVRGEVLQHSSGLDFAVLEADPRRVLKVLIRRTTGA